MQTFLPNIYFLSKLRLFSVVFLLILSVLTSKQLYAQGLAAGINIESKAIVTYSIENNVQTPIESSPIGNTGPGIGEGQYTHFLVDRKIDLSITSNGDTNVTPGETQAELNFILSNDGNDTQEFLLTPDSTLTADNFDTSNCIIKITAVTGTPLNGVVLPTYDKIKLGPDQQASISVKCDIPFYNNGQPILNNHISELSINATAKTNKDGSPTIEEAIPDTANSIDTVFTDGAGIDDDIRDASHSTRGTYIAQASTPLPTLSIKKSILKVTDSNGSNKAESGSEVTYKITISTVGQGIISDVIITDPTPTAMTYKEGSITLDGGSLTDSIDTDQGDFNISNNISTINLGDIVAGNQQVITLTYIIN